MLSPEEVEQKILEALPGATVVVQDLTGTGDHFDARVMSEAFEGKSLIEQHQMVYKALGEAMKGPIHALKLTTMTPEQ